MKILVSKNSRRQFLAVAPAQKQKARGVFELFGESSSKLIQKYTL